MITEQPLPQVVFKSKPLEDPYTVVLFTGACADVQVSSKARALLVTEEATVKQQQGAVLESDQVP